MRMALHAAAAGAGLGMKKEEMARIPFVCLCAYACVLYKRDDDHSVYMVVLLADR